MKIALYLGSFNPFHNGHLEVVKTAINDFKMDKVVIVPTMQNPWKEEKVLDIDKRVHIIYNSLYGIFSATNIDDSWSCYIGIPNYIELSLIEKELIPPYYSYATFHALKNKYCNDEIFVLCGEDTMKNIPNWMNGEAIIQDYDFLIVDRPDNSISSTEIRDKVRKGEDISKYVNVNVINLIKKYYE